MPSALGIAYTLAASLAFRHTDWWHCYNSSTPLSLPLLSPNLLFFLCLTHHFSLSSQFLDLIFVAQVSIPYNFPLLNRLEDDDSFAYRWSFIFRLVH